MGCSSSPSSASAADLRQGLNFFIYLFLFLPPPQVYIYPTLASSCTEWVSNATTDGRHEFPANGLLHAPSQISYRKQASCRRVL